MIDIPSWAIIAIIITFFIGFSIAVIQNIIIKALMTKSSSDTSEDCHSDDV